MELTKLVQQHISISYYLNNNKHKRKSNSNIDTCSNWYLKCVSIIFELWLQLFVMYFWGLVPQNIIFYNVQPSCYY